MTIQTLIDNLQAIPPLELRAMSLLPNMRRQTGEWFPTGDSEATKQDIIAATVELVAYTERCAEMSRRLRHLTPIALDMPLLEFGL